MNNNIERRIFNSELRANGESRRVEGYAATYNNESHQLGWFKEVIEPGAFERAIERSPDIVARFNHDDNIVLARTSSGTLEVRADENGLYYVIPEMPKSREDIFESIQRGDISKSSFAFTIAEGGERWEERDGTTYRHITEFERIYDVAPVTFPAYPDTSVAKRSFEQWVDKEIEEKPEDITYLKEYRDRAIHLMNMFF